MSNLCSCNNSCGSNNGILGGGSSCIWIILLLVFCGGCGNNGCGNGNGILGGSNGSGCDWLIWILLISCFCGGGCGNSNDNDCNCGCNSCC